MISDAAMAQALPFRQGVAARAAGEALLVMGGPAALMFSKKPYHILVYRRNDHSALGGGVRRRALAMTNS